MKELSILRKLEEKDADIDKLVEESAKNEELLRQLLDGFSSSIARVRFGSAKVLRIISERGPESLYSYWEFFVRLLDSENNILKWNAMDIISNLTRVDSDCRFEGLFKKFYGYLYEGSLITAGHVVDNSGTIALAKPGLWAKITNELLKTEEVPLPTEECRNILIGKVLEVFDVYYDKIKDKEEIVSFVKRQLNTSRRATRVKAEKLLKKLEEQRTR